MEKTYLQNKQTTSKVGRRPLPHTTQMSVDLSFSHMIRKGTNTRTPRARVGDGGSSLYHV